MRTFEEMFPTLDGKTGRCELEELDGPTLAALVEASASSSGRGLLLPIKSLQAAEVPPFTKILAKSFNEKN